jgi:DNA helicase II / ATP-dependent DNA helicase PcrA
VEKPKLIIAGPGAGKTFNMVQTILDELRHLSPARYMVVITYTNSATENIKKRLSKKITPPPNLFIGTIHSFLNRFIVIPFSSLNNSSVGTEKLFLQCQTDDVFESYQKSKGRTFSNEEAAILKARIKNRLNEKGYISFDQTVALAKECVENDRISSILCNRIQYLFIDEFQDTNNSIFEIIEGFRKGKKTKIYCVGDPEQFIQSFDIKSKIFANIPILKALGKTTFEITFNTANYRSSEKIVGFLNNFNARVVSNQTFQQNSKTRIVGHNVKFISAFGSITAILPFFDNACVSAGINKVDRCIIAKKNDTVRRIVAALDNKYTPPAKNDTVTPIKSILDTLLSALGMSQSEFCVAYKTNPLTLRKHAVAILKALQSQVIKDENTFGNFVVQNLGLTLKPGIPVKVENIRIYFPETVHTDVHTVSNIHTIKGLEADAVLAVAKSEKELLLWIETDRQIRETHRGKEETDYPRLGYVAFSRAKQLLCIACLEQISPRTKEKLTALGVDILSLNLP